jgi:hypothetical protein
MKLIGSEKMPGSWPRQLEELIVSAIAGEHRAVVETLDALVKGYRPDYEFHGFPAAATAAPPDSATDPLLPRILPPSKSVH